MAKTLIESIEVEGLFGEYDYRLPLNGTLLNPTILYGENGVGKSTVLTIVFHLLSAAPNRSHRGFLLKAPFRKISVRLASGHILMVEKPEGPKDGPIILQIIEGARVLVEWVYSGLRDDLTYEYLDEDFINSVDLDSLPTPIRIQVEAAKRDKHDNVRRGMKSYLEVLEIHVPSIYFVGADRYIESDQLPKIGENYDLRRAMAQSNEKRVLDFIRTSRSKALQVALDGASRWVQSRAVRSTNLGSTNVHSVYEQVLAQLANDYGPSVEADEKTELEATLVELNEIEKTTKELSQYELTTALDMTNLRDSILLMADTQTDVPQKLISPYLQSVLGRLEALNPIYLVLDSFVSTVNSFLTHKKICFSLSDGFSIVGRNGNSLDMLSSGEQQLLLLFSYALTARDRASVFIVDEPEISLNIIWQRKIVASLLEVAGHENIQFIFASHSIELIALHRKNVVELIPE